MKMRFIIIFMALALCGCNPSPSVDMQKLAIGILTVGWDCREKGVSLDRCKRLFHGEKFTNAEIAEYNK